MMLGGNHKVLNPNGTENTNPSFIGNINPFRYKGYYYDQETNWYYLKSRYYDSFISKFISIDSINYLDPEDTKNNNLFAYCANNPVMYLDRDGNSPTKWWEWALAGTLVAGLIVGSVLTGGLLGAAFIGASIGGAISLGTQAISGELSWGSVCIRHRSWGFNWNYRSKWNFYIRFNYCWYINWRCL